MKVDNVEGKNDEARMREREREREKVEAETLYV